MRLFLYLLMVFVLSESLAAPVRPPFGKVENDYTLKSRLEELANDPLDDSCSFGYVFYLMNKVMKRMEEHFETTYMNENPWLDSLYKDLMDAFEKVFLNPEIQRLMEIIIKPIRNVNFFDYNHGKKLSEFRIQLILHRRMLDVKKYYFSSKLRWYGECIYGENHIINHNGFAPTPEIISCIHEANDALMLLNLFASNTTPLEQIEKEWEALRQTPYPPIEELIPFMKKCAAFERFRNLQTKSPSLEADSDTKLKGSRSLSDPDFVESGKGSKMRKLADDAISNKVDLDTKLEAVAETLKKSYNLIKEKSSRWHLIKDEIESLDPDTTDFETALEIALVPYKDSLVYLSSIQEAMDSQFELINSYDSVKEYRDAYRMVSLEMARSNIYDAMKAHLEFLNPYSLHEKTLQSYQTAFLTMNEILEKLSEMEPSKASFAMLGIGDAHRIYWKCTWQYASLCHKHKYMKLLCKIQKNFLELERKPSLDDLRDFFQKNWNDVAKTEICQFLLEGTYGSQLASFKISLDVEDLKGSAYKRKTVSFQKMKTFCAENGKMLDLVVHFPMDRYDRFVNEYHDNCDIMVDKDPIYGIYPSGGELEKVFGAMREVSEPNLMSDRHIPSFEMSHSGGTMFTGSPSEGSIRAATSEALGGETSSSSPNLE